jgi:capsular exopolysaccharide synthesis family protein
MTESYRTLRTNIEFTSVDAPIRTLLVTSTAPSEGKTITAANLAVAFAQAGQRTILVDTDLRKPGVHTVFRLPNVTGLTTMLRTDTVALDSVARATEQANLRIVTTGPLPATPAEMLGSHRMRAVVEQLKAASDLVIFDAPPSRAVTDAVVMSSYLDATLLVVDAEHTRRDALRRSRDALERAGAHVLGVVLNKAKNVSNAADFGYYSDEARVVVTGDGPPVTEGAASTTAQATTRRGSERTSAAGRPPESPVPAGRFSRLGLHEERPDGAPARPVRGWLHRRSG